MKILKVPAKDAVETWKEESGKHPQTGLWPVILGSDKDNRSIVKDLDHLLKDAEQSAEKDIASALTLDAKTWFLQKRAEYAKLLAEYAEDHDEFEDDDDEEDDEDFEEDDDELWEDDNTDDEEDDEDDEEGSDEDSSSVLSELKPETLVSIILVPVKHAWEVPARLAFGGWNECPMPAEQSAVLREWEKTFGAVPFALTSDVLELMATRLPVSKEEALGLAKDQYIYCSDIVDQGIGSEEALADSLLESKLWFFWWD